MGKHETTVFTLDISEFLGEDGNLSDEGRGKVRELLMEQFRKRFPLLSAQSAVSQVDELLADTGELSKIDTQITITARSVIQVLRGLLADSTTAGQCVANLAQMIDKTKPMSGAHVFELGAVSAQIEGAREMLIASMACLEMLLSCQCVGGTTRRHGPPIKPPGVAN